MSDKMKQQLPAQIRFVDGESPPAAKLTAITAQFTHGLRQVEKAIGDLTDANYPYSTDTSERLSPITGWEVGSATPLTGGSRRTLDIVNLARLIGPASNLNPHEYAATETVTEAIPVGVHEFALRYPVADTATVSILGDTGAVTKQTSADLLDAAGDWLVTDMGRVYLVGPTSGGTITYDVDASSFGGGTNPQDSGFNTIPDIAQLPASGVVVSGPDGLGRFTATLPVVSAQQWTAGLSTTVTTAADYNHGAQLEVPSILSDNLSAGDIIPEGFLVLKNFSTGAIYSDAIYYYDTTTTVKIGGIDLSAEITAGDVFYIATVGNDITGAIDDLRRKSAHSHNRKWGEPLVDVNGISGWCSEAGASGVWTLSEIPGNFAPQYLHRDGWISGVDENANTQNAMRGWLAFGNQDQSAIALTARETFGIQFGASVDNRIYRNADDGITIKSDNDIRLTDGLLDDGAGVGAIGVKPVAMEYTSAIAVGDYGFTSGISTLNPARKPMGATCLLKFDGGTEWISPNSEAANSYELRVYVTGGSEWGWKIKYTGSTSDNATIRLVMWFN